MNNRTPSIIACEECGKEYFSNGDTPKICDECFGIRKRMKI